MNLPPRNPSTGNASRDQSVTLQSYGTTSPNVHRRCKVMLVDDSLVVRGILRKILISDPEIQVVASVGNGKLAVEEMDKQDIDAVILDIEMPVMDGITALPLLLEKKPNLVVLVASTLSQKNADISMKCLELGAQDYIPKPTTQSFALDENHFKRELIEKVKQITKTVQGHKGAQRTGSNLSALSQGPARPSPAIQTRPMTEKASAPKSPQEDGVFSQGVQKDSGVSAAVSPVGSDQSFTLLPLMQTRPKALVIGSSTGGPQALAEVFRALKGTVTYPVFIAQHMPPIFTKSLAAHIEKVSGVPAKEGQDGEVVKPGQVYVAPGDFHMEVKRNGTDAVIKLNQSPPENFCRPSVNPLFRSVANTYSGHCLGLMLTGLGADGSQASKDLVDMGGSLIAQDEKTSVVWGMPAAVAKAGLCSAVLPLQDIGRTVVSIMKAINPRNGVIL